MYKSVKKSSISLLDFRRKVAQQALKQHGTPKLRAGPKVTYRPITTSAIRFDGINHWPVALPSRYSKILLVVQNFNIALKKAVLAISFS